MAGFVQRHVVQFFRWWLGELVSCLPAGLRKAIHSRERGLVLAVGEDSVVFWGHQGKTVQDFGQLSLSATAPVDLRESAKRFVRKGKLRGAPLEISLPREQVLQREIHLPLAAAENLREVLGFEMDRFTPFKASEIYFDYKLRNVDRESKQITVDLALVQRPVADNAITLAKSWDLDPITIGFEGSTVPLDPSFNFLPGKRPATKGRFLPRLSLALVLLLIGLGAAAIYLPLYQKQVAVAEFEAEMMQAGTVAVEVSKMENQLNELIRQSQIVIEEKRGRPTATSVLNEVTKLVPDDTWLRQLSWKDDRITLAGYSQKASALIGSLERSQILTNVRFNSSVVTDPRSEMDRFNLSASISRPDGRP
jgi:general secretion pathway protein L